MQLKELFFSNLLKRALSEWPKSLNLELETEEFEEVIPTDEGSLS